jgi:Zn-dependent protease with chaperone function
MPHIAAHEKCHERLGHNQKEKRIRFLRVLCRPLYNWLCWQMELEADACATRMCGKENTTAALAQLASETPPTATLFALFYSSHPPPKLRAAKC